MELVKPGHEPEASRSPDPSHATGWVGSCSEPGAGQFGNSWVIAMSTAETAQKVQFDEAMAGFIAAGYKVLEEWDSHGWNADDEYPGAEHLWPTSVDEWLLQIATHYQSQSS